MDDEQGIRLTKRDKTYIDLSLAFTPSALTDDITLLRNIRAINNAIKNIIMILPGEVPFGRDIGSTTQRYLFDLADDATAGLLGDEIKRAIMFCEPRVSFTPPEPTEVTGAAYYQDTPNRQGELIFQDDLGVHVTADPDDNGFEVVVKYRISGTNQVVRVEEILTPTR